MALNWSGRPREHRWAIIGMAVAGVIAFVYAFDSSTLVRYLITSAGLLIGLGGGQIAAKRVH